MNEDADSRDWSDYESGPFCRHFSDPADCEIVCARCGHKCTEHGYASDGNSCLECDCEAWKEPVSS